MPIAVCSSLSLGLAVDFAIHYIERLRWCWRQAGDLTAANEYMVGTFATLLLLPAVLRFIGPGILK